MSNSALKVFISYRREDNPDFVERIHDWFILKYGRENVFMDFDSIPPFTKFEDFIRQKVHECDVIITIIGPRWLELMQEKAKRFQNDFVRIEIALALQSDKLIAPLCIKGANIPPSESLPDDLKSILKYNFAFLDSGSNFLENINKIIISVEREFIQQRQEPNLSKSIKQKTRHRNPDSDESLIYLSRADVRSKQGDIQGAIADYTKVIELNPKEVLAYIGRGQARVQISDVLGAISDFDKAIDIAPDEAVAYIARGQAHQVKGNIDQAIDDFNKAIELAPNEAIIYVARGQARQSKGNFDGAIADFNKASQLNSTQ